MNRIVSVNVGQPTAVKVPGADGVEHLVVSGIFKAPVEGPVMVRTWGLAGDGQADTRVIRGHQVHGGASKVCTCTRSRTTRGGRQSWAESFRSGSSAKT